MMVLAECSRTAIDCCSEQQIQAKNRELGHKQKTESDNEDTCWYQWKVGMVNLGEGTVKGVGMVAMAVYGMGAAAGIFQGVSLSSIFQPEVTKASHTDQVNMQKFSAIQETSGKLSAFLRSVQDAIQSALRDIRQQFGTS